ncbi:tRNA (adenosine(37)-N6)-threonylcarbamoyltransferase complex dimerization subunit type 1 TsaB [Gleimia hominis]|uniref:tRNA (adenosine(37)-N6)-threonylcarbamoyltransferase complex dimerization subunit type 1 TsaB n=1 Tax=Gleimia hominis TaxID=595468 RepID=UPI000C7FD0E2|nr:tRNA (adenosine(37)-N6)-threonylcarbamoyltransferase complex dimerization subunit type 1 TsaB [Gleimia hominis]WIK64616.1 tRNA (adenosine(37)-N6)-threonylcarbamoyltransferase complex dimerization subunit type 1 TsaB [Gleimia hominis]
MIDLVIDTSAGTSVAVVDGSKVVRKRSVSNREHAEKLSPLVHEALEEAGVEAAQIHQQVQQIIVGTGPAPFTGLRSGLVTARAMGFAAELPVRGVCSLDIYAREYLDSMSAEQDLVVVTDARRKEVYWAHYRANGPDDVTCLDGPSVDLPQSVASRFAAERTLFAGPACELYPQVFDAPVATSVIDPAVAARIVRARLNAGVDEFGTEPLYLRRPDIHPGYGHKTA